MAAQVSAIHFPAIEKFGLNPQPIFWPTTERMQFSKLIWNPERWVSEQPNARLLLCTVSIQLTITAKQIEEMKASRIQHFIQTDIWNILKKANAGKYAEVLNPYFLY